MEEVDETILPILRSIGWQADDDVTSIQQFTDAHIYSAACCVVAAIRPGTAFSKGNVLPPGKAQRFRSCTNLSNTIEELGYNGSDLGYQSFLYPNVRDMRTLLMWLVGQLPKAGGAGGKGGEAVEILGANETMNRRIFAALTQWSSPTQPYDAHVNNGALSALESRYECRVHALALPYDYDTAVTKRTAKSSNFSSKNNSAVTSKSNSAASAKARAKNERTYAQKHMPYVSDQLPERYAHTLPASLFEKHTTEVVLAAERDDQRSDGRTAAQRAEAVRGQISDAFTAALAAASRGNAASSSQSISEMVASLMSAYRGGRGFGLEDADWDGAFARRAQFGQESDEKAVVVGDTGPKAEEVVDTTAQDEAAARALNAQREQELLDLRAQLEALASELSSLISTHESNANACRQMDGTLAQLAQQRKELTATYKVKKKTIDLLPDADNNLKKLQELLAASSARLLELGAEWEEHRLPLIERLRGLRATLRARMDEVEMKVQQIKRMRAQMKAMVVSVREKEALAVTLTEDLAKLPKSISRQVYVRRIMDIVKNLSRQKVDIDAVLTDIRKVQRDINTVSETNKRSFTMTDEIVYSVAKQKTDATATAAYKYVVLLKEGFDELVTTVENIGRTKSSIRELQQQIDRLQGQNTDDNMERLTVDLKQVKSENKALKQQIKAAAKASGGGEEEDDEA